MDSQGQDSSKQAHDNAIEAGKLLADAQIKAEKAEALMLEANRIMSDATAFQAKLNERQKKLDRAFVALNKQKTQLKTDQMRVSEHDLLVKGNVQQY